MSDEVVSQEQVAEMRKKRTFRKFTFRGVDLDKLLDLSMEVGTPICMCTLTSFVAAGYSLLPTISYISQMLHQVFSSRRGA